MMRPTLPHIHQVSLSDGGVPKLAVSTAHVTVSGLAGDRQRNRKYHGGADRAVCLYSLEVIEALRAEGHSIAPGSSGENLTLAGLEWTQVRPGDRLTIGGTVQLEITSYTTPCRLNGQWFKDGDYGRIAQAAYPGWSRLYARVLREGTVTQSDAVVVEWLHGE
ncbi:MAG: MOSC domain-containing protein [Nitrospira sp.]|nr:MOSC domain-containing protein [Nitrospira sp.]